MHTYSLIHDDLPSMDNDDFRRGIPTNHKQFSESTAILAGDALNSFSFYLLSKVESTDDLNLQRDLLEILHKGGGGPGMVSGQVIDIFYEKEKNPTYENLNQIHSLKTGALIVASILLGNRLRSDYKEREYTLRQYAEGLGILFQLTDDILDEESSLKELGKTPGKDVAKGKLTYPSLYGMDESKKIRNELVDRLKSLASKFVSEDDLSLQLLPDYIAQRKN
jgi:geranylgeranyl diphosphate synthase type II